MVDRPSQAAGPAPEEDSAPAYVRRYRGRKAFMAFGIILLIVLLVAVAALWIARRPIATGFLLLAAAIIILAERRAAAVMDRLSAHVVVTAKPVNLRIFAAAIALGAAALIVTIWLLK